MGIYIDDYTASLGLVLYHRARGETTVLARGTFDLSVHEGHIDFLSRAKDLGAKLMVNVNNDAWVEKRKRKAIMTEVERARLVALQDVVDYVFVHPFHDIHPAIALAILARPDILVRENKDLEFQEEEKKILLGCLGYLPDYRVLPRSKVEISTSELFERMKNRIYGLEFGPDNSPDKPPES